MGGLPCAAHRLPPYICPYLPISRCISQVGGLPCGAHRLLLRRWRGAALQLGCFGAGLMLVTLFWVRVRVRVTVRGRVGVRVRVTVTVTVTVSVSVSVRVRVWVRCLHA